MKNILNRNSIKILFLIPILFACNRDQVIIIPDNDPPVYSAVPIIAIENYVNRLFIDLIGREPLAEERILALADLRRENLSMAARDSLIRNLQTNLNFVEGDSSYRHAYARRQYELAKEQIIEGASEAYIAYRIERFIEKAYEDSLKGDAAGIAYAIEEELRLEAILEVPYLLKEREIDHREAYGRMIQNFIYDDINKGSYNFIYASFEDLLGRFPTNGEYKDAFDVIEYNLPGLVLNEACKNKVEYTQALTHSREFAEAMIRSTFLSLLARQPDSEEMLELIQDFYADQDYERLQRIIMMTDEYARF